MLKEIFEFFLKFAFGKNFFCDFVAGFAEAGCVADFVRAFEEVGCERIIKRFCIVEVVAGVFLRASAPAAGALAVCVVFCFYVCV